MFDTREKTCPKCSTRFRCGPDHESGRCWCEDYPPLLIPSPGLECLCPACLGETLSVLLESRLREIPKEVRRNNPLFTRHARPGPPVEGPDFYRENGYMVFTAWFHLKRGECCGNGCRHCPYRD